MKIVIVGAGISGCAAYLALKKHLPKPPPSAQEQDHSYTIYEAYDVSSKDNTAREEDGSVRDGATHSATLAVGGGLGVAPNGLNVLRRLDEDLLRDIVRNGYPYSHGKMKNSYGWTLMRADVTGGSDPEDPDDPPMNSLGMSRHALWKCLRDRVPDEIIVHKRVSQVVANAEGRNVVKFADGSEPVEADLVIGADGLKSTVKKALFPEAEEDPYPPQYEGLVGVGGFIPASPDIKDHIEKGAMTFVFGGNGFFGYFFANTSLSAPHRDSPYHISEPGDTVTWWSTYSIDKCPENPKNIDREDVSRQLRERHGKWRDPVIQKIVNSVQVQTVYPAWMTPELPTWERDGVVLLGDAAHALPSTSGQGASQALEDVESFALFLSHYLRQAYRNHVPLNGAQVALGLAEIEKQTIKLAAKKHMDLRMPRVKQILERTRQMQSSKKQMNILKEFFMYLVLWIIGLFFPRSIAPKEVLDYNVAKEVERMLASDKAD